MKSTWIISLQSSGIVFARHKKGRYRERERETEEKRTQFSVHFCNPGGGGGDSCASTRLHKICKRSKAMSFDNAERLINFPQKRWRILLLVLSLHHIHRVLFILHLSTLRFAALDNTRHYATEWKLQHQPNLTVCWLLLLVLLLFAPLCMCNSTINNRQSQSDFPP